MRYLSLLELSNRMGASVTAFSATFSSAMLLLFTFFSFSGGEAKLQAYSQMASMGGCLVYLIWLSLALWLRNQVQVLLLALVTLVGIPMVYGLMNYYLAYGPIAMDSTFYWFYLVCLLVNIPVALLLVGGLNLLSGAPRWLAVTHATAIGGVCGFLSLLLTILGTLFAILLLGPSGGMD